MSKEKTKVSVSQTSIDRRKILMGSTGLIATAAFNSGAMAQAQKAAPAPATAPATGPAATGRKPNILIIWGDDIGIANISAYSNGLMGYETPNIDRIGREGIKLTALLWRAVVHCGPRRLSDRPTRHSHRADQGRLPRCADGHEPVGSLDRWPAQNLGYATGQFGKNHVGDRITILRLCHGFASSSAISPSDRRGSPGVAALRRIRPTKRNSVPAVSSSARRPTGMTPPSIHASARWASRPSRILVR